jgi:hypothetical protein
LSDGNSLRLKTGYSNLYPRPLILSHLSLDGINAILGDIKLLGCNKSSVLCIDSGLLSNHFRNISLECHLFKLVKKYAPGSYGNEERDNSGPEAPFSILESSSLKTSKFIVLDDPCQQRFVDQSYWQWVWNLCLVVGALIVGRCGADIRKRDAESRYHIKVEERIQDRQKEVQWQKMESTWGPGLRYFIISKKLSPPDARRYFRQETERLKAGESAYFREAEKLGLERDDHSKSLDRLKVSEGKPRPSNEEIRKLNESAGQFGITILEFSWSPKLLQVLKNLLAD